VYVPALRPPKNKHKPIHQSSIHPRHHTHSPTPPPRHLPKNKQLTVKEVLDFIVENGFNAIRLPFSLAMALDLQKVNTQWLMDEGALPQSQEWI
jgi:hypothetical protein